MKKLFLFAITLFAAGGIFAQTPAAPAVAPKATVAAKPKQVQNPAAYACPKCFQISKGTGKCDHCQTDKVQLGTYYCSMCVKSTGAKAGKCPSCGMATTQMTRKYCAQHAGKKEEKKEAAKEESKM